MPEHKLLPDIIKFQCQTCCDTDRHHIGTECLTDPLAVVDGLTSDLCVENQAQRISQCNH